jgi:hypothetical protein
MSQSESTSRVTSGGQNRRTVNRPYQKPEVRHERVFETMAPACGKVQTSPRPVRAQPQGLIEATMPPRVIWPERMTDVRQTSITLSQSTLR